MRAPGAPVMAGSCPVIHAPGQGTYPNPVVASAVVTGKIARGCIPARVRHVLSAEAGANDALAIVLVILPVLVITRADDGQAVLHWVAGMILWDVLIGAALGAAAGYVAARAMRAVQERRDAEEGSLVSVTLALALLGAVRLAGSDGLLAAFVAGVVMKPRRQKALEEEQELHQTVIERFFTIPVFVLLGMLLPWDAWVALGWRAIAFPVAVLLLAHGITSAPLTRAYGRRAVRDTESAATPGS